MIILFSICYTRKIVWFALRVNILNGYWLSPNSSKLLRFTCHQAVDLFISYQNYHGFDSFKLFWSIPPPSAPEFRYSVTLRVSSQWNRVTAEFFLLLQTFTHIQQNFEWSLAFVLPMTKKWQILLVFSWISPSSVSEEHLTLLWPQVRRSIVTESSLEYRPCRSLSFHWNT